LLNWSFEADTNPADDKPDEWSILPSVTRGNAIAAHHGSFVAQFSDTGNRNHTLSQTVPSLTAGASYSFIGWVNIPAQNDAAFVLRLQVRWLADDNSVIGTDTIAAYTSTTSGWVRAQKDMVAPAGTDRARVQAVASSLNGKLYVDQFVFRP
jgi:hypothetical protein